MAKRIAQQIAAPKLQRKVDQYLAADEKAKAAAQKVDEIKAELRATAVAAHHQIEAKGIDPRTIDFPGSGGAGVNVVFKAVSKALTREQADAWKAQLGEFGEKFFANTTELTLSGNLAAWFLGLMRGDFVLLARPALTSTQAPSAVALAQIERHEEFKLVEGAKVTNAFFENRLAFRGQMSPVQIDCLREIQERALPAPTVTPYRPKTPLPVADVADDSPTAPAPAPPAPPPPASAPPAAGVATE